MAGQRLFVAIDLPATVADFLVRLNPHLQGVRWLAAEQIHLTLNFLGFVTPENEVTLREKLKAVRFRNFFLPVTGVGTFPGKGKPAVIWAGVGKGHPQLFHLHQRVQDALLAAGLEPDLRAWHPHITIARCRDVSAQAVRPFLKAHADFDAGVIPIASFSLYSSVPGAMGSVYTRELEVHAL
jgi:2'-5' RNA ligase